jgi:S1-C subfamily serine protease
MLLRLVRFWGFMLCVGTLCQALRADSIPDIVAHSKPAIIEVIAFDDQNRPLKSGTGFFITSDGVAVTNFHVNSRRQVGGRDDERRGILCIRRRPLCAARR